MSSRGSTRAGRSAIVSHRVFWSITVNLVHRSIHYVHVLLHQILGFASIFPFGHEPSEWIDALGLGVEAHRFLLFPALAGGQDAAHALGRG